MKEIVAVGGRGINFAKSVQLDSAKTIKDPSQFSDFVKLLDSNDVCLVVGLGGSSSAILLENLLKHFSQKKTNLLIFASYPFSFEGKSKKAQADKSINTILEFGYQVHIDKNDDLLANSLKTKNITELFMEQDQKMYELLKSECHD